MDVSIKDHLEGSQRILEMGDRHQEPVLQQIEQAMLFFILFIKIMLRKEQIF